MGAEEHDLPEYYIEELKKIKHNGEEGCIRMVCLLIRYGRNKPCECKVPGRIPRSPLKLKAKDFKINNPDDDENRKKPVARKFRGAT